MTDGSTLTDVDLFAIASRPAPGSTMRMLCSAQAGKHALLIKLVGERIAEGAWDEALAVFDRARTLPSARILADPWTGAWAARCLRQLDRTGRLSEAEKLHFNALAAAEALAHGLDADLILPVRDGFAYVPLLGSLRVSHDGQTHRIRIRDGKSASIPSETQIDTPGWLGHRWLDTTAGGALARAVLDDIGPYRNVFRLPLHDRLPPEQVPQWQRLWGQAWQLLAEFAPQRVTELVPCLNTAVPLSNRAGGAGFSATSRDAFGAFALSNPGTALNLAITLVHEGQHAKLDALLDLTDLYQRSSNVYFAPWRKDARPIGGLLQGVYAFLGIADTWHRLCARPDPQQSAQRQLALLREQVAAAASQLGRAPELTGLGRAFAAGIRAALDELLAVDLPAGIVKQARAEVDRLRANWLRANAAVV